MENDSLVCFEHTILVHSSIQVLLNLFLYVLVPLNDSVSWLFVITLPVSVCNCLLGTIAMFRHNFQWLLLYCISLISTLIYRIFLLLQLIAEHQQKQQLLHLCDSIAKQSEVCSRTDQIRLEQFNLKSALGFISMSTFGEAVLFALSVQLAIGWFTKSKSTQLLLLQVKYDASRPTTVVSKTLVGDYGTFQVLDEDGSWDNDVQYLRQVKRNRNRKIIQQLKSSSESIGLLANESQSTYYEDAEDHWTNETC